MLKDNLISDIHQKLLLGQKLPEIKKELLAYGWEEEDIDKALLEMFPPKTAKKDVNVAGTLSHVRIKKKYLFLIGTVFAIILYNVLGAQGRDSERDSAALAIGAALNRYYSEYEAYPEHISQMVPQYIKEEPLDPTTKRGYRYMLEENGRYKLCIYYETKQSPCPPEEQ